VAVTVNVVMRPGGSNTTSVRGDPGGVDYVLAPKKSYRHCSYVQFNQSKLEQMDAGQPRWTCITKQLHCYRMFIKTMI
jgi:hypothetical protein